MQNDNNLLNTPEVIATFERKNTQKKLIVVFSACVFLGIVLYVLYRVIASPYENQNEQQTPEFSREQLEGLERGGVIADLYNKDKKAGVIADTTKQNYGFEGKATETPSGTILVSASQAFPYGNGSVHTYSYNLNDASATFRMLFAEYALTAMVEPLSFKTLENVFLLAPFGAATPDDGDELGIHRYSNADKQLTMLQSTKGFNERNFAWSSDKKLLAFNRMRTDLQSGFYDDLLPVENWETVVVDPEKDLVLTTITESSNPQWSPDGSKLVYLKRDGLYVRDISGTDGKRVVAIPEDGVVTTMSMIAVSPDGKKLLWSIAKAGVITLYEIIDWETFTITEKARMQTEGVEYYWPLFSPDSNFFAVQAIDALKGDALFRENPRMEIRGIGNREPSQVVSLTEFNFDQLFTDTWVEKIQ